MRALNRTRGSVLATRVERARSPLARLKGLMFRASLAPGEALLLEPESAIHTFFMRFPIDVLYLDRGYRVLRAERAMAPNRVGPVYTRGCHAILELPAGTLAATSTQEGDEIQIG